MARHSFDCDSPLDDQCLMMLLATSKLVGLKYEWFKVPHAAQIQTVASSTWISSWTTNYMLGRKTTIHNLVQLDARLSIGVLTHNPIKQLGTKRHVSLPLAKYNDLGFWTFPFWNGLLEKLETKKYPNCSFNITEGQSIEDAHNELDSSQFPHEEVSFPGKVLCPEKEPPSGSEIDIEIKTSVAQFPTESTETKILFAQVPT